MLNLLQSLIPLEGGLPALRVVHLAADLGKGSPDPPSISHPHLPLSQALPDAWDGVSAP